MEYVETIEAAPLDGLQPYPDNARVHDLDTIRESLEANGQYRSLVVRLEDDGTRTILAGHGTAEVLAELGHVAARIELIRCDDEEARRINLVDNRANEKASNDDAKLLKTLRELDDLRGTGYVPTDLDDLSALLEEQSLDDLNRVKDVDDGSSGVRSTTSLSEYADRYGSKLTRVLIAEYHNDVYAWIIDRLAELRDTWGLNSNAEAIRRLIEEQTSRKAPAVPDGSVVTADA